MCRPPWSLFQAASCLSSQLPPCARGCCASRTIVSNLRFHSQPRCTYLELIHFILLTEHRASPRSYSFRLENDILYVDILIIALQGGISPAHVLRVERFVFLPGDNSAGVLTRHYSKLGLRYLFLLSCLTQLGLHFRCGDRLSSVLILVIARCVHVILLQVAEVFIVVILDILMISLIIWSSSLIFG